MFRTSLAPLSAFVALGAIVGCSGGSGPLAPATAPQAPPMLSVPQAPDPVTAGIPAEAPFPQYEGALPAYHDGSDGEALSGGGAMGLYGLRIDRTTLEASLEPLTRSAQLGEDYDVDVTDFFRKNPCSDCLKVTGLSLDGNQNVTVGIEARHPFAVPAPGTGRLDLHVYDMQLQVIVPGGVSDPDVVTLSQLEVRTGSGPATNLRLKKPGFVANADGYASHLAPVLGSLTGSPSTAYPYIALRNGAPVGGQYDPNSVSGFTNLSNPVGYNVFGMGQSGTGDLVLRFEDIEQVGIILALDARYGASARRNIPTGQPGARLNPRYFLPEYNRKEAWRVKAEVTTSNLIDSSASSFAQVRVEVNDWQQHLGTVRPGYDFFTAQLDSLRQSSRVALVELTAPDLMSSTLTTTTAQSGDGSPGDPLVYTFTVPNTNLAAAGGYFAAVAIRDELRFAPPANGGIQRDGVTQFAITDYTAYQVVELTVEVGNAAPTCVLDAIPAGGSVPHRTNVALDASGTTDDNDPQGALLFEWDFDYDGITFDVDATGLVQGLTLENTTAVAVNRTIALRVTDTAAASCLTTVTYTVQPNQAPNCVLSAIPSGTNIPSGTTRGFIGSTSSDLEDPLASLDFEWDTNYNGSSFVPNPTYTGQTDITYQFNNPGATPITQVVAMQVTDTDGASCLSSISFTVGPNQRPVAVITRPAVTPPIGTGVWSAFGPYPNTTDTVPIYLNRTQTVDFSGTSSFDPDGTVVAWAWDFENVNVNSSDFGVGFTSDDATADPAPRAYMSYGSTYAALRVTDNVGAHGYLRREVMVTPWGAQALGDPDGQRRNWDIRKSFIGTAASRTGNTVISLGYGSNNAETTYFLNTHWSTDAGASWTFRAAVDNQVQSNSLLLRSAAVDVADGANPYAAYMDGSGNLAFRRAPNAPGTNMWNPGSIAPRAVITTTAAAGYATATQVDIAVRPENINQVVVGVIANNTGGLDFWASSNASLGGTSTWTRLTGVLIPVVGGATARRCLSVVLDTAGDCHAVWQDVRPGADAIGYGQFSTVGTGSAYGNQLLSSSTGVEGAIEPALWVDTADRPVVVWSDDLDGSKDIFLRRGDSGPTPTFTSRIKVSTDDTRIGRPLSDRNQTHPSVAVDGAGRIWVIWQDTREDTFGMPVPNPEIYGVVLDSTLAILTGNFAVNNFDQYNLVADRYPWLAIDRAVPGSGANSVTAFWTGDTDGGTNNLLSGRATFQ